MRSQWFLVGAGRCGLQLARAMTAAGFTLVGIETRSPRGRARARRALPGVPTLDPASDLPDAEAILVAVPDSALAGCARDLAPRLAPATRLLLHTSGLFPASAMAPAAGSGRSVGSLHPLVSFASGTGPAVPLLGVTAAVEGDPAAVSEARALARALGMRPVRVAAERKPAYHAAAAVAANLTHTLVVEAKATLMRVGFSGRGAAAAVRPLLATAMDAALAAHGIESLTGPLARGDAAAVRLHLAALAPEAADAYRAVGALAVAALAAQDLLDETQISELTRALTGPVRCARFGSLA